jgi:hypothetical protein
VTDRPRTRALSQTNLIATRRGVLDSVFRPDDDAVKASFGRRHGHCGLAAELWRCMMMRGNSIRTLLQRLRASDRKRLAIFLNSADLPDV